MTLTKNDPSGLPRIAPWYGRRLATFLGLLAIFSICIPTEAGDILRPGLGPTFTGVPGSAIGTTPTSASTQVRADAQSRLARTTQAIQAVQAMQNAARAAAISGPNNLRVNPLNRQDPLPDVPDGLTPGGLQVVPGATANSALWQGANLPIQSTANGQTTVNIKQTRPQAILSWQRSMSERIRRRILIRAPAVQVRVPGLR
jgi:hypothetical protein